MFILFVDRWQLKYQKIFIYCNNYVKLIHNVHSITLFAYTPIAREVLPNLFLTHQNPVNWYNYIIFSRNADGSGLHTSEGRGMRTVGDIMYHMFSNIYSTVGTMSRGKSIYAKFLHCWGTWWILSSYFIHFPSIVFFYMLLFKKKKKIINTLEFVLIFQGNL